MAAFAKATHIITVGNQTFSMVLPDEYLANGSTIGTALGISKLAVGSAPPAGTEPLSLRYGIQNGLIFHVRVSWVVPTTKQRKSAKVVCSRDNIGGGLGLAGQTFRGNTLTGSNIPSHLSFS